ncbi:hypothetical protein QL285_056942 [Trifolium repens]|nr:hypothetical protein QL285_056942 [Trifolium repens]
MPVRGQVGFEAKNDVNMTNMESICNQSTENSVNVMEINREQAQESSSSRSSTVQPRFLIGVQHAPSRLFIGGLFSELFDFELVRVIEEDQEGSMENDNEISGKKFSNSENISLYDRVVKLKDTLAVEDCAGLSRVIIKLYSWRKSFSSHLPLSLVALKSINIFKLLVMDLLIWMIRCNPKMLYKLMINTEGLRCRLQMLLVPPTKQILKVHTLTKIKERDLK